jgi:hypothetical protein
MKQCHGALLKESTSMMKKILFCFPSVALVTVLAASSQNIKLFQNSMVGGKTLTPGDYKMELKDSSVVLKHNKNVTEVPATTQTGTTKFSTTSVRYNDHNEITEICIGGTNKKVVLSNNGTASNGAM